MIARRVVLGTLTLLPVRVAFAGHDQLSDLRHQRDLLASQLDHVPPTSLRARRLRYNLAHLNAKIVRLL